MPLYEYLCTACGRLTEKRQKFSDPEISVCPHCEGSLERTITAPAVQFKGGGWYADGYGSKKPTAAGGTATESSPAAESVSGGGEAKNASSDSAASTPASAPATAAPAATSAVKTS